MNALPNPSAAISGYFSILVIELNVYKGNETIASAMFFPQCISIVDDNSYELICFECCFDYNNEIFNERSNSNGR